MSSAPIVCPFCPLCCDDVAVQAEGAVAVDCPIAAAEFPAAWRPAAARYGKDTFAADAIDAVASRLKLPPRPTVTVRNAALAESRLLCDLEAGGKLRLQADSTAAAAWSMAVSRDGIVSATLGDVLRFADLVICLGDFDQVAPRLGQWLRRANKLVRSWKSLGVEELAALQHSARGGGADSSGTFSEVITAIKSSAYVAVMVGDNAFADGQETVIIEGLLRWVTDRNLSPHRVPPGNEATAANVARAVAVRVAENQSLQHVYRYRENRWAISEVAPPPPATIRLGRADGDDEQASVLLQIGGVDPGCDVVQAYLPAAVPGVHCNDATIRGDGSVTLPLAAIVSTDLPSRSEILRRVLG